jgi:hypothetical protein
MPDLDPAWSGRLRAIFGAPLGEVEYEHIEALIPAQVSEAADLDFKEALYGNSAGDKHELCKDVAAMRNHRGGVIVLGVRDDNGVAVAVAGVAISDDEALRMRQIVAAGTAPHAEFEIRPVAGPTEGSGFYLLVADPSPYRPHAVVVNDGLRFPRRDGTTTRWLSEVEVADLYRDRFRGQADQLDRLARIGGEARDRVVPDGPWLVAAAVPNHAGSLSISFPGRRAIEEWARTEHTSTDFVDGFFEPPAVVMAGVGVERYTLTTHFDQGQQANHAYAECHTDGAAAAARILYTPTHSDDGVTVIDTSLVMTTAKCLRLIGRHARRAGALRGRSRTPADLWLRHAARVYARRFPPAPPDRARYQASPLSPYHSTRLPGDGSARSVCSDARHAQRHIPRLRSCRGPPYRCRRHTSVAIFQRR